ncbi:MAG: transposase [Gemmatimonadaceae bacterium]
MLNTSRLTTAQTVAILQGHAAGASPADLIRRHGISRPTFYHWKQRYGDLQVNEAKRLNALEEENRRLKRLVADQALNLQFLKDVLGNGR